MLPYFYRVQHKNEDIFATRKHLAQKTVKLCCDAAENWRKERSEDKWREETLDMVVVSVGFYAWTHVSFPGNCLIKFYNKYRKTKFQ